MQVGAILSTSDGSIDDVSLVLMDDIELGIIEGVIDGNTLGDDD